MTFVMNTAGASLLGVIICIVFLPSMAQIGSDCSTVLPCSEHQVCSLGYCRCEQGFVKPERGKRCFPERSFNESCFFTAQCVDYRMKCEATDNQTARCACVKYYHWDPYSRQCLTHKNLSYMLGDMDEKYDSFGHLDAETTGVFSGLVWTGLAVMLISFLLASGCFFYGCCYRRWCGCGHDKLPRGDNSTGAACGVGCPHCRQRTRQPSSAGSNGASGRIQQPRPPVAQGAGVDFIPALYQAIDVI